MNWHRELVWLQSKNFKFPFFWKVVFQRQISSLTWFSAWPCVYLQQEPTAGRNVPSCHWDWMLTSPKPHPPWYNTEDDSAWWKYRHSSKKGNSQVLFNTSANILQKCTKAKVCICPVQWTVPWLGDTFDAPLPFRFLWCCAQIRMSFDSTLQLLLSSTTKIVR